jgi:TetR/AcrR family transcriptional repressor of lmrAB and yxaGH operons
MVETAGVLLRRQGYAATGWRRVIEDSGTPWGSQHHHFPGGKEQLASEALRLGGEQAAAALTTALAATGSVSKGVRRYIDLVTEQLVASGYQDGCPVATVALETIPASPALADVCASVLEGWAENLATALRQAGASNKRAAELATFVVLTIEGALLMARVRRDPEPLKTARNTLVCLLDEELSG